MKDIKKLQSKAIALRAELDKIVSGYDEEKTMIIVCLLADGHVLLEAVPGTAKTTLVNTLRSGIDGSKSARIQMTPDLKPTDITHMLFALTGNDTTTLLQANLSGYTGEATQHYVGLRIPEHQKFIKAVFTAVGA